MSKPNKPLAGYTVLDLTWVYSGPYCTSLLLDLGAEIIKIEAPKYGDHTRSFPPFKNGVSGYFYSLNRGKKSLAINLKSEDGKKLFEDLVAKADIVVENFVPGAMDRLGLGYEALKKINPRIIYGDIHAFGSFGPYSSLSGVDPVAQAMGGLMSQSGFQGGAPLKTGPAVSDAIAGIYLALGVVSAILERNETGVGKKVEVGMMDAVFSVLEESVIRASMTGDALNRRGNTDPLGAPWDAFETSDGKWVMICTLGGGRFQAAFNGIGRPDIAEEFGGDGEEASTKRADNLTFLNGIFAEWVKAHTVDETLEFIQGLHVPCGVVKEVEELLEDPHLIHRNMVVDIDHPKLGKVKTYNNPILFDGESLGVARGENPLDPEIGEHSRNILKERLNLTDEEIDRHYSNGTIWK